MDVWWLPPLLWLEEWLEEWLPPPCPPPLANAAEGEATMTIAARAAIAASLISFVDGARTIGRLSDGAACSG